MSFVPPTAILVIQSAVTVRFPLEKLAFVFQFAITFMEILALAMGLTKLVVANVFLVAVLVVFLAVAVVSAAKVVATEDVEK